VAYAIAWAREGEVKKVEKEAVEAAHRGTFVGEGLLHSLEVAGIPEALERARQ
jgi:hypothetical protein